MQTNNTSLHGTAAVIILLLLSLISGCLTSAKGSSDASLSATGSRAAQPVKQTADKLPATDLTHASLPVSGMTCADCEEAIQHSVAKLSGVSMVKANHLQGRVEVDYDPRQVNEQQIIAAIERLQYKVENPQAAEGDQAAEDAADLSADDQGGDDSADGCGCCGGSKGDQGQQA